MMRTKGREEMPASHILIVNFALVVVLMTILWCWAVAIKDVSFIDSFWAYGMVMVALATFFLSGGDPERKLALTGLACLWGLRLGTHLFRRWRASGIDPRYAKILGHAMEKKGWSFSRASFQMVFAMQAVLLFIVCLPVQLGQIATTPMGLTWLGWVGVAVALTGIAFETIGDAQLTRHRNNPAMKGKVLDTGLWRYTRHPNYFGDACTWWGLWLIAAETGPGLWALPGPILLTWLLTRLSGVPMLERALKKTRPGYEEYVRRTSGFFPLPPKDTR
jgi:steroid 5-alpha reductase family enzyme